LLCRARLARAWATLALGLGLVGTLLRCLRSRAQCCYRCVERSDCAGTVGYLGWLPRFIVQWGCT
jgi:hypothetical protein